MKRMILLAALLCISTLFSACDLLNNGDIITPNPPKDGESLQTDFVGTWYEVGSTEQFGTKLVFTESNVTYCYYSKNDTILFYDNVKYALSSDSIKFQHYPRCPEIFDYTTTFIFYSADTLEIKVINPNSVANVYPPILNDILLVRYINEK